MIKMWSKEAKDIYVLFFTIEKLENLVQTLYKDISFGIDFLSIYMCYDSVLSLRSL